MAFNLPQFLRRTPRTSLREYLRFRSIALSADFDWSAPPRSYLGALRAVVENLLDHDRERVYQDFEHADILSDEPGQLAIRSLFADNAPFIQAVEGLDSSEARSLVALMENETIFRKALAARLADRFRTGRSWSGFRVPRAPSGDANWTGAGFAGFEADLRSIFNKLDGSGRRLSIDRFDRDSPDGLRQDHSIHGIR